MSSKGTGLRCFVASLAILSLAGHLSAVPLAAGVSCQNNNPFIKIMKDQGVELYSQPKQVSRICGDEFELHGTCCNLEGATRYAVQDKQTILAAAERVAQEYAEFAVIPKQLLRQLVTIASIPKTRGMERQWKLNNVIDDANKLLKVSFFRTYFKTIAKTIRHSSDSFLSSSQKCWTRLANLRSSSVCSTCSGRSDQFFKDGMVLVDSQVCVSIVQDCVSYIEMLVNFIEALEDLPKILEKSISSGLEINLKEKLDLKFVHKYFRSFKAHNILALVGLHKGNQSSESRSGLLLCEYMLRLKQPVLVVEMQEMFAKAGSWKITLDADVTTYLKQVKASAARTIENAMAEFENGLASEGMVGTNWSVGQARRLQLLTGGAANDVQVRNQMAPVIMDTPADHEHSQTSTSTTTYQENSQTETKFIQWTDSSYTSVGVSGNRPMRFDLTFP